MKSKVVLITGGSSGIGKSIGTYLQSKGLKVYGTTRKPDNYPSFDAFQLLKMEVTNSGSIQETIATVVAKEGRIDVLINNAGVGITGAIEETPHEEINRAFDINFNGPIHMIKAVLPQMRKQKAGLIINITSIAGFMGLPYRGIYSATKGAMELLSETLRMETKDFGIHITSIAPGDFATNIAAGRFHSPVLENSPYKIPYQKTLNLIDEGVNKGEDPILIAHIVLKVIQTKNPKVRYKVGSFMQKFSLRLKYLLPDKVFEKLLLNHYKL